MNELTALANKYNSDKGTTYACAHGYTEYYDNIFKPYKTSDLEFKMLEIGLNRDNQNSTPSLNIYREFFGDKVSLYGFDIHPAFNNFHDPNNKLHIIIEGNIGSGKTTCIDKLESNENFEVIREPVDMWLKIKGSNDKNLLQNFYEDQSRYSYLFQTMVFKTRLESIEHEQEEIIEEDIDDEDDQSPENNEEKEKFASTTGKTVFYSGT
jgi:hypothetical protein